MNKKVCYFGDDAIGGAASYLSGVMTCYGIPYDRIDSDASPAESFFDEVYDLYILSDYPRRMFDGGRGLERIAENVTRRGSGLLMIGGWESFYGRLGEYHETPLAELLPVVMEQKDDRRNYPVSVILHPIVRHPITDGLPWGTPPGIGGFNAFVPKKEGRVIIEGVRFDLTVSNPTAEEGKTESGDSAAALPLPTSDGALMTIRPAETIPMLVIGEAGKGRTAAFASDAAPHWVGGFVDWGEERIWQAVGEGFIEVGRSYAEFWRNLVRWTAARQ